MGALSQRAEAERPVKPAREKASPAMGRPFLLHNPRYHPAAPPPLRHQDTAAQ